MVETQPLPLPQPPPQHQDKFERVRTQEIDWFTLEREMGLYLFQRDRLVLEDRFIYRRYLSIERRGKQVASN